MKLPRDLSGAELIKLLGKHFGYWRVNHEGSHVILETKAIDGHTTRRFLGAARATAEAAIP